MNYHIWARFEDLFHLTRPSECSTTEVYLISGEGTTVGNSNDGSFQGITVVSMEQSYQAPGFVGRQNSEIIACEELMRPNKEGREEELFEK